MIRQTIMCKWHTFNLSKRNRLFPFDHTRILKFNPNNDTTSFVGEDIEGRFKFSGTIKGKNGCLYGIPSYARRVANFNVATQNITFIGDDYYGDDYEGEHKWEGGVEGMNDNIYGVPHEHNK